MAGDKDAILTILNRVQESVRNVDYEAVRDLIPDDGLYFGSVAPAARGFEELCAQQFTKVWPNISEFKFIADSIDVKIVPGCGHMVHMEAASEINRAIEERF